MLTPSCAHDEAFRRDAGHDSLQKEFLTFLRERRQVIFSGDLPIHRHVEAEYPFHRHGNIVAYADAVEILHVGPTKIVNIFEIKPKIHTVFGIVRQIKALVTLGYRDLAADICNGHIIVPAHDPKIGDLRDEWPHTWAWNIQISDE